MNRVVPLLAAALMTSGCAARAPTPHVTPERTLADHVDSITSAPPLQRTSWGILLADAQTGEVLIERNGEKLYIPASNTKLVVSLTALGRLGPEYRYRTPLLASGWTGDSAAALIIQGSGDPTWSARVHGSVALPIDSMAGLIAAAGLGRIGTIISDASLFQDDLVNPTWEAGDLPWQYAPPIDAVAAGEGVFRLVMQGGAGPGQAGTAFVAGPLPQPIRAEVVTDTAGAPARLSVDYTARRDTIHLQGSVAAGVADTSTIALTQPARSVAEALADALRRRGVTVAATRVVRDSAEAESVRAGATQVAEWQSPPMSEIVSIILRPSQNWVAEQVLKTLGARLGDGGGWREGIEVEESYLRLNVGIDSGAVNLRDASGMSAQNLLTPRTTVAMLIHALAQPWAPEFRSALAGPGIGGSTLNSRLRSLEGRLSGKTGTISNVNSLSGYLTSAGGRDYVFAIMTNGSGQPSGTVRSAIDAIVLALAREVDARDRQR